MDIFLWWVIFSIIVAVLANSRGKNAILYFFISIIITPILGLIIVLVSEDKTKKKCSNCGQMIDISAKVCPFCHNDKDSRIIRIDNSKAKLILDKKSTTYTMNDLKRIAIDNYDEKYKAKISVDNDSVFSIGGSAGEYGLNYLRIESNENEFLIEAHNMNISPEFEANKVVTNEVNNSNNDNIDKLIELGKLYKEGLLSKEEFEEQKRLLL